MDPPEFAYIICPVRQRTPEQDAEILALVAKLETQGVTVYLPGRDSNIAETPDNRNTMSFCVAHRAAVERATIIPVHYSRNSEFSLFDLGMAWYARKPIQVANVDAVERDAEAGLGKAVLLRDWSTKVITGAVRTGV